MVDAADREKYVGRESKLVLDWVQETHPKALQWRRVRMGPLSDMPYPMTSSVLRRWADLVFFDDDVVHIVEAKMRPEPGAISQLLLYAKLWPATPEFSTWSKKKVELILLTTMTDPVVRDLCKEQGITYVVYAPPWVETYLKERWGIK